MIKRLNIFILLLCFAACKEEEKQILVRLENTSPYDFENLSLHMPENTIYYGDIKSGQVTYYQLFSNASSFPSLSFTINGKEVQSGAILADMSFTELPTGNFTYQTSIQDGEEAKYYWVNLQDDVRISESKALAKYYFNLLSSD